MRTPLAFNLPARVLDQIGGQVVEDALQRLVEFQLAATRLGCLRLDFRVGLRRTSERPRCKASRSSRRASKRVVQIGRVVGNFVDQIDELRFERRPLVEQIFRELGKLPRRNNRANA